MGLSSRSTHEAHKATCSWVMGPNNWWGHGHKQTGGGQWRSQYEARWANCMPPLEFPGWQLFYQLCCKLEQQNDPNVNPLPLHKLVFVLWKCSKTLPQQCRIPTIFRRQYTPDPRFGGREGRRGESFFFAKNVMKLSYNNAELTIFRRLHPRTPILGEKFVLVLRKSFKTLLQQSRILKFVRWVITLHYRHFKRHLGLHPNFLKWPLVHQQLHVIRNTAHRPSSGNSRLSALGEPHIWGGGGWIWCIFKFVCVFGVQHSHHFIDGAMHMFLT